MTARLPRSSCPVCDGTAVEYLHHQRFVLPEIERTGFQNDVPTLLEAMA